MDFAPADVLMQLKAAYLDNRQLRKTARIDNEKDEIACMHPQVGNLLHAHDWKTEHHVSLPSGHVIDWVASNESHILAVECKPRLTGQHFFLALGQAICYAIEYGQNVYPAIATYSENLPQYAVVMCKLLGVTLITLPEWHDTRLPAYPPQYRFKDVEDVRPIIDAARSEIQRTFSRKPRRLRIHKLPQLSD